MNISRRATDPLLAALTNPTELARRKGGLSRPYLVVDKNGQRWPDAEAAYKAFKTGDTPRDGRVMVRIVAAKLRQHPELVRGIVGRGGVAFLERCDHRVGVRGSRLESRFIRCLIAACEGVR